MINNTNILKVRSYVIQYLKLTQAANYVQFYDI